MRIKNTEIFIIPIGRNVGLDDEDIQIVYSPFMNVTALVTKADAEALKDYYTDGKVLQDEDLMELKSDIDFHQVNPDVKIPNIDKVTKMSFLPNLTCNFSCSYCYSAKGRSNVEISWEKAKSVLDYFINPKRIDPQDISLFISGGGEPLLSWNLVRKFIKYANNLACTYGFNLRISLITNGSLLTKEIALFLKENHCSVCVSFEVLKDLQNDQRRSFDKVSTNIKMLGELGVSTLLNSTITPLSVGRMSEMTEIVADNYPFVLQYTMEPVTGESLFEKPEDIRSFYDDFYDGYIESKQIAKDKQLCLRFTFDDALRGITMRHCPGKFCITPQGTVSICHLASSPKEKRYARCVYGNIDDAGKININYDYFKELYNINVFHYDRCQDCFAKWSCGGECLARNDTYTDAYMEEVCRFNRKFIKHLLIERIENNIKEQTGKKLWDYVRD